MPWLALGSALLFLAVRVERGWPPLDPLGLASLAALTGFAFWSPSIYHQRAIAIILIGALLVALVIARLLGNRRGLRPRLAAFLIGCGACSFALLGPAGGLF